MTRAILAGLLALAVTPQTRGPADEHRCAFTPRETSREVVVRNVGELERAAGRVEPDTTILLEDGEYALDDTIDLSVPGTVLRSQSGDRARVTIRGHGMGGGVGVALSVSAADVTIADLTVSDVSRHGIQIRGERQASRAVVHNVHIIDAGEQLLKGSVDREPPFADDGLVACSRFEYRDTAPSDYTDGVDLIAVRGWVIRDNTFVRIRGPQDQGYVAGPAILVWGNSQDTVVERNVIIDSFRGIAIGLVPGTADYARNSNREFDHQRGVVRNNVICNMASWADEAIEASASTDFLIEHNTVMTAGTNTDWSIGVRYPVSSGVVRNNLTSSRLMQRDGAQPELTGNVTDATPAWFVNADSCDLHLTSAAVGAIDAAVPTDDREDFDGLTAVGLSDVGAFEFRGRTTSGARR
jgi:hypothetical protein